VRTAIGAGRARIAAQLLVESLLVSLLAGAAGMGLAWVGVQGLERLAPPDLPRLDQLALDGRVLGFGLLITLVTGLLFGLVPAVDGWRADVRGALAAGGRGGIGTRGGSRFRRLLVVIQLSLATVLALGSGLLFRSFSELRRVELGFEPEGTLVMSLSPAASSVAPDGEAVAFYRLLENRLAGLPGVASVGSALRVPLVDGHDNYSIRVEGDQAANVGEAAAPGMQWATHGYFEAMGIPLRGGRYFSASDDADAPLVAVVSESLARELWPGQEPIGKRLAMWLEAMPWMQVVGVVADAKHQGVQAPASAMLYVPHAQAFLSAYYAPNAMSLFVRADGDPAALVAPVRATVHEMDPTMPIGRVQTMADVAGSALARERFTLLLIALFSVVALTLSAVGVYGVVAQAVSARTREIGVRMAIGAGRADVAAGVLREGLVLAAWGVAIGLASGAALSVSLSSALYGVSPLDPWALAATAPVLAVAAAAASLAPALRAARLDPVEALRDG
jgi:predicted permease